MLVGFGAVLVCLLGLLGTFYYLQVKATVIPLTRGLSQEILAARSAGIGHLFHGYVNEIRTLSRDGVIRGGDPATIRQELQRRQATINSDYEMLFFADANGNYVSSIGSTGHVADRAYFKAIMVDGRDAVIGEPIVSRATGATVFVVACAVVDPEGRRVGLIAATVLLDTLTRIAGAINIGEHGFGWVMDHQGLLIAHPSDKLRMKLNLLDSTAQGYRGLEEIGRTLARGEAGVGTYERPDGTRFVTVFNPIPNTPNWGLGVSVPEADLMGRAYRLMRVILWGMAVLLAAVLAQVVLVSGRIAAPIKELQRGAERAAAGDLDQRLEIRTGDEIQSLAETFNRMNADLKAYIRDLRDVTAVKERVESELRIANRIQASMLPRIFPPFPDIEQLDLYATMQPARDVGGDFFDFFVLDDKRFVFGVGDVSGKGVPAALFMVIAMTILRNQASRALPLDQVIARANDILCGDNDETMFVTVFMGVVDPRTGELEYVNAGHNPPLLARAGGDFRRLEVECGRVLGAEPGYAYRSARTVLKPGDMLFLYTDGVTEAMNGREEFFGEARTVAALDDLQGETVRGVVNGMRAALDGFTADTPASDDVTMLALTLKG